MFQDKRYKNREHLIIKELDHPNVIRLIQAYFTPGENVYKFLFKIDEVYLNLVMDYIPETLSKVIRNCRKTKQPFAMVDVKIYAYQMLKSLAYLKAIGICHRDIKP